MTTKDEIFRKFRDTAQKRIDQLEKELKRDLRPDEKARKVRELKFQRKVRDAAQESLDMVGN
jgi:hypothetical protein